MTKEEDRTGQRGKSTRKISPEASTVPTGRSGAGMALQSCPKLRYKGWTDVCPP